MIAVGWSVFSKLEVYRKLKGYGDLSLSSELAAKRYLALTGK
jgi:hypothetical protein